MYIHFKAYYCMACLRLLYYQVNYNGKPKTQYETWLTASCFSFQHCFIPNFGLEICLSIFYPYQLAKNCKKYSGIVSKHVLQNVYPIHNIVLYALTDGLDVLETRVLAHFTVWMLAISQKRAFLDFLFAATIQQQDAWHKLVQAVIQPSILP